MQEYSNHNDRTKYKRQLSAYENRLKKDYGADNVQRCLRKIRLAKEL